MAEPYFTDPNDEPSKAAKAMRRYRKRLKNGDRCFKLVASCRFLDALVKVGFLREDQINDEGVQRAVYALLNAWGNRGI